MEFAATMSRNNLIFISTSIALAVTLVLCFSYFFFIHQPAHADRNRHTSQPTPTTRAIKESDVSSLTLETIYREYFEEGSKCRKTYNELFGNNDGFLSENSPCSEKIAFQRDGQASKSVEVRRYDKTTKEMRPVEKQAWKAKITDEQFKALADSIVASEIFQNWKDGIQIYTSNSTISVSHATGTRRLMSNVDKSAIAFLPLIDAFKNLDRKVSWEKTH
jgi:hypothetical protein